MSAALGCADVEELSAELALGLAPATDRAAALVHLNHCEKCQRLVDELATVADRLLLLGPEAEPAIGFESRVLAATASSERQAPVTASGRRFRSPRVAAAAVVVLAIVGGLLAGLLAGLTIGRDEQPVRTALAVSASGRATCRAFAFGGGSGGGGDQAWVVVRMEAPPEWMADYTVEVTRQGGGAATPVGRLRLQNGEASLAATLDGPPDRFRGIRVLDPSGALRYEAAFGSS